ncbi:uncharacterized protein LACBIDRAFT_291776 [Laccaria bicolor S238N-H82]|uniref:Predicted protein n=1 Tax=Laccaria bicolor (strain S238N-H82 / ATCC MYA-4686) TaxID=486041 RepID=B0CNF0_LACBS|nr:uncharacterized protein LACBIDRAFT_291776 [Laccaria bicolor S238N-H82]EDR15294.1 predicted protein [Laccaria bicolor S238N-H82]|eukprot:XP_001873502.1 predicted protein [Laccaria bicolor S238N-H82]
MSTQDSNRDAAERLKVLGNKLHQNGEYLGAYVKYSEAIQKDPKNAVLYANRAASSLALKKLPSLTPNTRRPGQELELQHMCIDAWETALSCLPTEQDKLSAEEARLKAQFQEGLRKAQAAKEKPPQVFVIPSSGAKQLPWQRATAMQAKLIADHNVASSPSSYVAFLPFIHIPSLGVQQRGRNNEVDKVWCWGKWHVYMGRKTRHISNGILRDSRVFHMDCPDWTEKYNRQVVLEAQVFKAWVTAGPAELKKEAPDRVKKEGWQSARDALATTVRAWIIQAFIQNSFGRHTAGVEFFSRAVDVLEWGRRVWKDVPKDDRGAIFEVTFVRGVKRLYLSAMHQYLCQKVPNCSYTKEDLAELARDIIVDTDTNSRISPEPVDPGFVSSFYIYPKGEAFSMLGWYHMQTAFQSTVAEDQYLHYTKSATYYTDAAECFPEDDEHHCTFLKIALEAYTFRGTPVKQVLALCKRIRLAIPKMKAIWEVSSFSQGGGDKLLQQALDMEMKLQRNILEGQINPDSSVKLQR